MRPGYRLVLLLFLSTGDKLAVIEESTSRLLSIREYLKLIEPEVEPFPSDSHYIR